MVIDRKKCCGTCKWLAKEQWEYRDCLWRGPLPDSNADVRDLMKATDGANCPCYEARDEQKGGDKIGES